MCVENTLAVKLDTCIAFCYVMSDAEEEMLFQRLERIKSQLMSFSLFVKKILNNIFTCYPLKKSVVLYFPCYRSSLSFTSHVVFFKCDQVF